MPDNLLPTYYYRDHFVEMLDAVERTCTHILSASQDEFIRQFRTLSHASQCLFIRMANRRGHVFHRGTLAYAEIDCAEAVEELHRLGFVRAAGPTDFTILLAALGKDDLLGLARRAEDTTFRASWTKAKLAAHLNASCSFEQFQDQIDAGSYIVREHRGTLDFLLFLYFGKTYRDLKSFALRDLGIVGVNADISFSARFTDREEANACFAYATLRADLAGASRREFEEVAAILAKGSPPPTDYAALLHASLTLQVGTCFEKASDHARAIEVYQRANSPECNERLARLLYTAGRTEQARDLLERMIDDPGSDGEHDFARDFYARKFDRRRIGSCTALLRDSESLVIDEIYRNSPESGAVASFRRQGWRAFRTENEFWNAAFGLLFWHELFGARSVLHSGFDRLPRCLSDRSFHSLYADDIAVKLEAIRQARAAELVCDRWRQHHGKPNGLFSWSIDVEVLTECLAAMPGNAMAEMIRAMTEDFFACRDGFPDLLLIRPGELRLVEIKAEGDVIRRNQLTRLRQLSRAGFDATICRVEYRYDPNQTYVVVDIETTGGRAGSHRIIEIGAVKLRNNEVIAEWHSLIDPECHIPRFITGLTGITDAMVAGAPRFADIADQFAAFMEDAVFAAHNVGFDYGFIAHEFRRLSKSFRHPKFCTCAGMRRHFPGQNSYSLGTLCRAFGVPLDNHHRALSDARAAGRLLSLINRRREEHSGSIQDQRAGSAGKLANQSA